MIYVTIFFYDGCLTYCHWPFDPDTPERIDYSNGDDINFAIKLRCSGWPYIYCAVAGRQARWLERQPAAESEQLMMSALVDIFGADIRRKMGTFRCSAWGDDPWVKCRTHGVRSCIATGANKFADIALQDLTPQDLCSSVKKSRSVNLTGKHQ